MYEVDRAYEVGVTGHGDQLAVFLGRTPVDEIHVGDFARVLFAGGIFEMVVAISGKQRSDGGWSVEFDWNGYRDGLYGGALLPDDVELADDARFKEVWRAPVCDYCDQRAVFIQRDGDDILCAECGDSQYDDPRESLSTLTVSQFNRRRSEGW